MPFDKDGRWYPPGDKWMIPTPKPTPAPAPAITEPPKPTNNFTAIIQNISNTLKAKMGVPPPYEMPVGDDLQQLTPPEPQEGILPAMLAPLRDVIAKQRERQIEQTAQWVQQHGGSAEAVRTPDYSRIPEVPRQFLAGLGSSLFLGQGVSEQERRQLGAPETTGGKVARAVGGFVGAAPLYSLLAPIGAAAKAQAVKLPIKNIIGRLAVQGAAGGGATVGTAEAIRQGVGLASGEQGITPESAAKSIAGSAAIGAGVGAAFNVAAPYISYAASRLLERFTKKGAVNVGQMASEGYTVQADSPEYQQLLNEGWRTFTKPKTGEAFLFKEGNVKFIVGAGGNIVGKTAPAIPKPLAQLQAGVIPKPVTPAPTIPKPPTTVAALTDAETRLVGLAQQQGRSLEDFESALAKAQQALVDQQVAQLWEYVKHTPGVVKRQRITIPGAVVGEDEIWLGGGSLNDSWYRDFYAAHKRAPRKKELADVARDILSGGYTLADGTEIPPNQQFVQMEGALSAIRSAREKTAAQGGLRAGATEVAGRAIPKPAQVPTVAGAEETLAGEVKAAQPPKGVLPFTGKQPSIPKSAQTTTATVREDDIVKYLSDHLTGPIRSGRFGGKGILGILKVQSGVIRANVARNLPVISHEVGHYIDEQLNLSGAASGEIIQLGKGDAQEGIGEFMRLYLTDTAKAQAQAPQYYAAFESKLPPKVQESLQTAQRMIRTWIEMPGRAKLHSRIYDEAPHAPQASTLDRFTAAVFDDLYALEKGAKQLAQRRVLPITEDPYKQARLAAGSAAWAEEAVKGLGVLDKDYNVVNESLMQALGPYAKNLDDFVDYAVAKRAQGYEARNMESGFEKDWIDETIQALDSPEMQAAFGRWVKWYDSLLKQLVDVGYLAQDDYVRITGANPDYVHFARIRGDIDSTLKTDSITGKSFGNLPQYIKARTGVKGAFGPPIYNPVATAIADAHRIANVVGRQRVFNATLELTRTAKGMGSIAEEIDAKNIHTSEPTTLAQDHIIRGKENGEDRYIQLDPELYRAFQSLDSKGRGALAPLLNMMNKISSVQRAGMTASNPEFALLVNPLVDQFTAAFYSDNGYIPFVDAIRGIRAIAKNNATYVKMKAAGGSLSAFAAQDRSVLNRQLQ
ncbi:MAG: hypothetical protein M0R06_12590, partial [Sphaerochaeta sp.]|nr:hypothetical protein [Sphaerochaeta sp.]